MDKSKDFVKRLVGLPGDKIEIHDGKLIINGRLIDDPPFSEHYYYNRDDWDFGKHGQIIAVPEGSFFVSIMPFNTSSCLVKSFLKAT